ncbi:MAG: sodium:proton exchanger [Spirochaetes bacterium GWD1_27_9]|nr:MAG: sodium:proton exchanger [Spirochaetes bacterium GWB1_27_13]OHD24483.1 MAG: sodium:proton exchanger [Spirochaetes bacterium GWC1_27_15]OHD28707.1 MAG: sodium:proton exchanger [Spirochaetes bacterium GWD1_27_9]
MSIVFLILGFIFLVKGADFFVTGASSFGVKLKIPQIVIGLTVVAFGTSLPELFINVIGSIAKNNDIVLGNIVGSNIFNILMILGVSALIYPITAKKNTVWKEIPFVILVSIILFVLSNDILFGEKEGVISRGDGLILIIFMGYFLFYLYKLSKTGEIEEETIKDMPIIKILLFIIIGIIGLVIGGNLVVESAVKIAKFFHLSDKIIALTIISIGTGLPELVTSVVAASKKNSSIALGNIVGSNIFNILLVIGVSSIIYPVKYSMEIYMFDYIILIVSSLILFVTMFLFKKSTITRVEGLMMILIYLVYIGYNVIKQ